MFKCSYQITPKIILQTYMIFIFSFFYMLQIKDMWAGINLFNDITAFFYYFIAFLAHYINCANWQCRLFAVLLTQSRYFKIRVHTCILAVVISRLSRRMNWMSDYYNRFWLIHDKKVIIYLTNDLVILT